ncbi:MAG: FAD-binding oxidoreductase [Chloroflexota bacterium]|nr:FAD-binding oxidoreductase [Chloroflexota bacterium]
MLTTIDQASGLMSEEVTALRASLRGEVIANGDAAYDEARKVFNAMIDKRPAAIAKCVDVSDVIAAVNFAREHGLTVAIRGGGHNGGGLGTVDNGVVIDLSPMKGIRVDPIGRTAQVQGGATFGDVDHATHAFGLAVPSGIISTTGVGGLTLGGGLGHLTRGCGLTIDNLLEVDVVLADGSFVTANSDTNPDLFWAVRGGGGNFGVITSFRFRLHRVSIVVAGPMLYTLDQAADVMKWYREFLPSAPRELTGFFAFLTVPPGPPFPQELHLKKMCAIVWCYSGAVESADLLFKPVRDFMPPVLDGVMPMPLPTWQSAFDALYPRGDQWYWRADFVNDLSGEAIALHVKHGSAMPTWKSTMHLYPIDGAASEPSADSTPWAYRGSTWAEVIVGVDPDPANADLIKRWTVDYWDALHPYSAGGAYVNFMMDEGQERVRATYRGNYARLAAIKKKYDPDNFFHINQNIQPTT